MECKASQDVGGLPGFHYCINKGAHETHQCRCKHQWRSCDHEKKCCAEHGVHVSPHVGCILR